MLLFACGAAVAGTGQTAYDDAFDATFERYQLPGLAVGVIADGKVVFRRAGGELVAGSGQPLTPRSLFKVASLSKAMTTALLARLADQGRLAWDDPVRRHLPGFTMHDPWVGAHMQLRDLLIHNSGLGKGAGDLMLWPEPNRFTRADVIAGLAHLVPTHEFRSHYAYDNILYIVAGEAAAAAGGASYEALMQREVFAPLGMARCHAGGFQRDAVGEVAQPHMLQDGRNVVIRADGETIPTLTSAAAGGIRCSLDDMLAWIRAWLPPHRSEGTVGTASAAIDGPGGPGAHIAAHAAPTGHAAWLSDAQREALWTRHMPMPLSQRQRDWEDAHFHAYGYGWRISDVHGTLKVSHTGTLAGMYAMLVLLPEHRAGFVILTNGHGEPARTVLGQVLMELLLFPEHARDVAHYAALLDALPRAPDAPSMPDVSARTPVAARAMAGRLGLWRDPWFGDVSICTDDGSVRFTAAKSPLLTGTVMQLDERLLVDWDAESVDAMPWLHFPEGGNAPVGAASAAKDAPAANDPRIAAGAAPTVAATAPVLRLSHVDPDADFSYDYADLAFTRIGDCPAEAR